MALGDCSALHEWRQRDNPPPDVWQAVRDWVGWLGDFPWQAPSVPVPELSKPPEYEVREAVLPEAGDVEVTYRHEYATGVVDLIWVIS